MIRALIYCGLSLSLCFSAASQEFKLIESFVYSENSQIEYDTARPYLQKLYGLVAGESTVFEYKSNNAGDTGNHSEGHVIWAFQINTGVDSFRLANAELKEARAVYNQLCRCQDKGISKISSGEITGVKKMDSWHITMDIEALGRKTTYPYRVKQTVTFRIAQD